VSNSGVIGDKVSPTTESAGGVHTLQEVYSHQTAGEFPTPYHISMTGVPSSIDEDSAFTVTVTDSSESTYSLPYLIDDSTYGTASAADFDSSATGNISMVAGVGTLVVTLKNDGVTENEHFHVITKHPVTGAYNFISGQIDIVDTAGAGHKYFLLHNLVPYNSASSRRPRLRDFRLWTGTGLTGTSYPPSMTSGVAPSPYEVTESFYASPSYAGYRAVDGSISSYWSLKYSPNASLDYLKIFMGSGAAISPHSVYFRWYSSTYRVTAFVLSGSNDNVNWTPLLSVSGLTSYTHQHDF
jgi:hypothetical protein